MIFGRLVGFIRVLSSSDVLEEGPVILLYKLHLSAIYLCLLGSIHWLFLSLRPFLVDHIRHLIAFSYLSPLHIFRNDINFDAQVKQLIYRKYFS
jgi:hypothetical protein